MICDLFIDEEGVYKPVPAPKSAPTTQNNNNQSLQQQEPRAVGLEGNVAGLESKQNRVRDSGHNIAPEYRMPPLYGEEQSSNQTQQASLQTHSSKFPSAQMQDVRQENQSRSYQPPEPYASTSSAPRTSSRAVDEEKSKSITRTYHTIKDMISSRFGGQGRKDVEQEPPEASLNNVADESRKNSSRSVDEEDSTKKKEGIYGKPRAQDPPPINVQQYPKNTCGQYGHSYSYLGGQQPNVPLPGQLQPSLPGQGAQLHVTHHAPPGGVQTVHQTQVPNFGQSATGTGTNVGNQQQQVQNVGREYVVQASGISGQQLHQGLHQNQNTQMQKSHGLTTMQQHQANAMQSSNQNFQSPQQLLHQNQTHHQSPRFTQQHAQNMQRQLMQQMHQQQQQLVGQNAQRNVPQSFYSSSVSYQQYQQARQAMSRSQIDLPSTSRQAQELRLSGQEVYYHYAQGRPRYGVPQLYMKNEGASQETEFQRRNSAKGIEKAASQPQLCYEDETVNEQSRNVDGVKGITVDPLDKERYAEFNGDGSKRVEGQYTKDGIKSDARKDELEHGMSRLKIQNQGSGSDYDKTGQSSSNVDSGRGSAVYSSGRRPPPEDQTHPPVQDSEWVDIVETELRSILEPRDVPAMAHSTLSESVSSVTPPLPPLSPHESPRTPRNRYSASLPYGSKPNYTDYGKAMDKRGFSGSSKHRGPSSSKKEAAKKFSHLFGVEAADLTSTTTGLDLDSMLDRSDSDLSTNDARTIRKQLEGLENMYSE
ncbi:uncharacterized protein LOC108631694, partial [Ceratina calcarata]|uniref:Uncharacterized protein LOC108631694 n=1 Tax=Ceratina calcarata TaxID=156304 RepID=A0AAJ7SBC2_9HYME